MFPDPQPRLPLFGISKTAIAPKDNMLDEARRVNKLRILAFSLK